MKLSTRTIYGLQFMIVLGSEYGNRIVQIREVAKKENISEKYLEQIVPVLKSVGLIRAVRGAYGGYTLLKKPLSITLKEIVESLEGSILSYENILWSEKKGERSVTIETLKKLESYISDFLSKITLGDLVDLYIKKDDQQMFYI